MRKKACIVKRGTNWAVKQPLPDGRYRWRTVGPRKRDAELLRDDINRRVALGAVYPSQPQTFAEFVDGWLARYAQRVRPATLASCRGSLKHLAVFDAWQLDAIRADDVEDHVFAIGKRAPRSAELVLKTIKMILRSAKERGQTVDEQSSGYGPRGTRGQRYAFSTGAKSKGSRVKLSSRTAISPASPA